MGGRLPFEGVRVADFSWIIAGPLTAKYLGVLGAEVIKIESRKRAEFVNRGPAFDILNNSKRSCTIDLGTAEGKDLAKRLVALSDVVVENFGFGAMDRLGLGYEALRKVKPDIIMLSSSGMGRTGPEREYVAYGTLLQFATGWSALTGWGSGDSMGNAGHAGAPPQTPGSDSSAGALPPRWSAALGPHSEEEPHIGGLWTDPLTALTNAFVVMSALHYRRRTGKGQFIDLSMAEATAALIPEALMDYSMNRRVARPAGNRDPAMAPHNAYPCAGEDRWVAIAVRDDSDWERLCEAMGMKALAADSRFADGYGRLQHRAELDAIISGWTRGREDWEVTGVLQAAGVPAGPSMHTGDQVAYPHLQERGFFQEVDVEGLGPRLTMPPAFRLGEAGRGRFRAAPAIGADNGYVLREVLGLPEAEVERLEREGVIY